MATYRPVDDGLVTCPLRPDHKVKRTRLSLHISKCRRSDGGPRLVEPCPVNPVNPDQDALEGAQEYPRHLMTCRDLDIQPAEHVEQGSLRSSL
ncbi:hypothetical protein MTO96_027301 [Rhipicephalus appendiculatus]